MRIFCKVKEKIDRAKRARVLLSNLSNINKFTVEFEIKDKITNEKIDDDYINILKHIIDLSYRTHIDIILSYFSPLDFAYIRTKGQNEKIEVILHDRFTRYYLCSFVIDFDFSNHLLSWREINDIYKDTIRYNKKELNPPHPNFCLRVHSFLFSLDFFISMLQNIKEEFTERNLSVTYLDVLDVFLEVLKKEKLSKKGSYVLIPNIETIIYYNFDIVFSISSESLKLKFRHFGWSWSKLEERRKEGIYIVKNHNDEKGIDATKKLLDKVTKKSSISKENMSYLINYILYQLTSSLIEKAINEKSLTYTFFGRFMELIEERYNEELRGSSVKAFKGYSHCFSEHSNKSHLSERYKFISKILINFKQKVRNDFENINEILEKEKERLYLEKRVGPFVEIYNYGEMISFDFLYYLQENKIYKIFSIHLRKSEDCLIITTHSYFYFMDKIGIEDIFSILPFSIFLEAFGINKYNIKLFLKKVEMDFLNFE